mmetsp:Transcript_16432/g.57428  ORF Transcript_16432/g.57428 Transcript_16432/m.57428 type:complete len:87 (+) Transcript_16432:1288-1548(+)
MWLTSCETDLMPSTPNELYAIMPAIAHEKVRHATKSNGLADGRDCGCLSGQQHDFISTAMAVKPPTSTTLATRPKTSTEKCIQTST